MQNENYLTMVECVRTFLEELGLVQYFDMFLIKGFDSEDDIRHINEQDLDSMLISDTDHRNQILCAASEFTPSDEFKMFEWLRQNGLEHYFVNFIQSEIIDIDKISRLNLPDEDIYDELEITLPGHKRRLERAVRQLRKRRRISSPTPTNVEEPLAFGRWSKPECLHDAKFDFLVVDAKIISTTDPSKSHTLEFMVDSGSDVVTIRQHILDTLDLEILGKIHSKGVHGSKTTNLYKAILQIGTQQMEIEVMGETYDSLGSRVVRHFRHIIDGTQHIWLKGNYSDSQTIKHVPPAIRLPEPPTSSEQEVPAASSSSQRVPMESQSSTEPASSSSLLSTSESLTSSSQGTLGSRLSLPSSQSLPTEDLDMSQYHASQSLSQGEPSLLQHNASQNIPTGEPSMSPPQTSSHNVLESSSQSNHHSPSNNSSSETDEDL